MITAYQLRKYFLNIIYLTLITAVTLFPYLVHGEGMTGFIDRNIWHTPETYHAGDTVRIYTALINTTGENVTGTVTFYVNDEKLGARDFSMRENDPVSFTWYDWVAEDGSHAFRAQVNNATSDTTQEITTLSSTETILARTEVAPTPVLPTPEEGATSTDTTATSSKDSVADYTSEAGEFIDTLASGARDSLERARESLDKKIAAREDPTTSSGITINSIPSVLGTSTTASSVQDTLKDTKDGKNSITLLVMKFMRGILSGAIGILSHPAGVALSILAALFIVITVIKLIWRKITFRD